MASREAKGSGQKQQLRRGEYLNEREYNECLAEMTFKIEGEIEMYEENQKFIVGCYNIGDLDNVLCNRQEAQDLSIEHSHHLILEIFSHMILQFLPFSTISVNFYIISRIKYFNRTYNSSLVFSHVLLLFISFHRVKFSHHFNVLAISFCLNLKSQIVNQNCWPTACVNLELKLDNIVLILLESTRDHSCFYYTNLKHAFRTSFHVPSTS